MSTADTEHHPITAWLDRRVDNALRFSVHNPMVGMARSLIALGTLTVLVATPLEHFFYVGPPIPEGRICNGVAGSISAFCVFPHEYLNLARWGAVLILFLVVIGFAPRYTAIPHWWISLSVYSSSNVMEGGDQVATVLTLLLIPICLTDRRLWHWQTDSEAWKRSTGLQVANTIFLLLIWLQVAFIYFHASLGKLVLNSWRDGTSFWYWGLYSTFGIPDHFRWLLEWLLTSGTVVVTLTWGTLLVEFFIACCLFAGHRLRYSALVVGVALHGAIALLLGLPGFSIIMFGALILYAVRPGDPFPGWFRPAMPIRGVWSRPSGGKPGKGIKERAEAMNREKVET